MTNTKGSKYILKIKSIGHITCCFNLSCLLRFDATRFEMLNLVSLSLSYTPPHIQVSAPPVSSVFSRVHERLDCLSNDTNKAVRRCSASFYEETDSCSSSPQPWMSQREHPEPSSHLSSGCSFAHSSLPRSLSSAIWHIQTEANKYHTNSHTIGKT